MRTTRKEPQEPREVEDRTCCRCGKPCGYDAVEEPIRGATRTSQVEITVRVHRRITIKHDTSDRSDYEASGSSVAVEYDACDECFTTVVRPALEALGFRPQVVKVDW